MNRRAYLALTSVLVSLPSSLSAQDERAFDARHRHDCRLAGQVLQTGNPRPKREWALEAIRSCDPEVAVPALVQSWTNAPDDLATNLLRPITGLRGRWQSIWFRDNYGTSVEGAVPLPSDSRAEVRRVAEGIANAPVRDALTDSAARLVRFLDVEF